MGRFRIDEAEQLNDQIVDHSTTTDLVERESDNVAAQDVLPDDAPAFVVAYQRNGTPFLIPYHPPKQRKPTPWWLYMSLLCLLTQLVLWYGPPAPPPGFANENESWSFYMSRHGAALLESTKSLMATFPYIGKWCYKGLMDDITDFVASKESSCILQQIQDDFWDDAIVGQSQAIAVTKQALRMWNSSEKALILVLSGTVGVGKLGLATMLAQDLVCPASVLTIDAAIQTHVQEQVQAHLHRRRGSGVVVIVRYAEQVAPTLLLEMLQTLHRIPELVLILTTHSGSRVIHAHLQKSNDRLDLALRRELDLDLVPDASTYISAIAPFVPLGTAELKLVCRQRLETWLLTTLDGTQIFVSEMLLDQMTSERQVEYLEWKSSGLTFSNLGAKALDPLLDKVLGQLKSCVGNDKELLQGVLFVSLEWDEEEDIVLSLCRMLEERQACEEECRFGL